MDHGYNLPNEHTRTTTQHAAVKVWVWVVAH